MAPKRTTRNSSGSNGRGASNDGNEVETLTLSRLSPNNCEAHFIPLSHNLATTSTTERMGMTGRMTTTTMGGTWREEMITTTVGMVTTTKMEMDARTRSLRHAG
ncbi:hypothetical protein Tco_1549807 [Tanacetum coccineum]